jgi:hypothetical protein
MRAAAPTKAANATAHCIRESIYAPTQKNVYLLGRGRVEVVNMRSIGLGSREGRGRLSWTWVEGASFVIHLMRLSCSRPLLRLVRAKSITSWPRCSPTSEARRTASMHFGRRSSRTRPPPTHSTTAQVTSRTPSATRVFFPVSAPFDFLAYVRQQFPCQPP